MVDDDAPQESVDEVIYDEAQVLATVSHLRQSSVGLDTGFDGKKISDDRKRTLEYLRGEMRDMEPEGINRSNATDSIAIDTIEAVLPDLIEIFTDEDVVVFEPESDEDVVQARLETDFIQKVIFEDNDGFLDIYTALKDALQVKTGIWKFWGEEIIETKEERYVVSDENALPAMLVDLDARGEDYELQGSDVVIKKEVKRVLPRFRVVSPENFGTLDQSARVRDNDYCVERSTPRVMDLRGIYPDDKIDALTTFQENDTANQVGNARDTQDEIGEDTSLLGDMRRVELYEHYVRANFDKTKPQLWRVVTNREETTLLDIEPVTGFQHAAITPFVNPHRFIGESLADKCIELQRIRTNLIRQMIDAGNTATNGRAEISDDDSNEYTLDDWMNNDVGGGVRSKTGNAVRPIASVALGFDVLSALEYTATAGEQRSGVGRQTMGLNSDAMHDTKGGQQAMLSRAQRRVRMIARIIAETGFRDLCLGLHAIIRESGAPMTKRINGKFVQIDPETMGERTNMTVVVGGGSREEAMAILRDIMGLVTQIVDMQGGVNGPIVDLNGVYKLLSRYTDLMPVRGVRDIWMSPDEAPDPEPPQPDPDMIKVQGELALKERELQLKERETDERITLERQKAVKEAQLADQEMDLKRYLALVGQGVSTGGFNAGGALNR